MRTFDNKYEKNGCIGVIISVGYGAGWSTWNEEYKDLATNYYLVDALINDNEITEKLLSKLYGEDNEIFCSGLYNAKVEWIPINSLYLIEDNDGYEQLIRQEEMIRA